MTFLGQRLGWCHFWIFFSCVNIQVDLDLSVVEEKTWTFYVKFNSAHEKLYDFVLIIVSDIRNINKLVLVIIYLHCILWSILEIFLFIQTGQRCSHTGIKYLKCTSSDMTDEKEIGLTNKIYFMIDLDYQWCLPKSENIPVGSEYLFSNYLVLITIIKLRSSSQHKNCTQSVTYEEMFWVSKNKSTN